MKRYPPLILLAILLFALTGCNYEQTEKYAIQSGFVEDGTKGSTPQKTDCTTFSAPTVPSTVSSGGLKVSLVIIQVTFEGSINQKSYGDPFAQQSFKSATSCWANKIFGTGSGQLNDYWQEVSYGKFMLYPAEETHGTANDGIITVSLSGNHPNFGKSSVTGVQTRTYFSDALTKADPYIDFSKYDADADGHLSTIELQVMFLVAGGESSVGDVPGIWGHKWCIPMGPTLDGYTISECLYQGYSTFGERQGNNDGTIGVIAHELGHSIFCLPDLYDTSGESAGIGYWGLMGSGSHSRKSSDDPSGSSPSHLMAWSKYKTDGSLCHKDEPELNYSKSTNMSNVVFVTPDNISSDNSSVTLYHSTHTNFNTKIINIPDKTKEYFLLENIGHDGYQDGLDYKLWDFPQGSDNLSGIAIWHIDENQKDKWGRITNSDKTHRAVDLEEAADAGLDDSHRGMRKNLFFSGNKTEFSDSTDPNSKIYSGTSSGITINNISVGGDSMTFDVTF